MKVKTISVTYGRKFNLGDFQSCHIESTIWADLDENDVPVDVSESLRKFAREEVKAEYQRLVKPAKD